VAHAQDVNHCGHHGDTDREVLARTVLVEDAKAVRTIHVATTIVLTLV